MLREFTVCGAKIDAGALEELIPAAAGHGRVRKGFGRTPAGRIWIDYQLSESVIAGGGFSVPAALQPNLVGEYELRTEDSSAIGQVTVGDSSMWGVRPLFSRRGGEPGDYLTLLFDTERREVTAIFGNESSVAEDIEEGVDVLPSEEGADVKEATDVRDVHLMSLGEVSGESEGELLTVDDLIHSFVEAERYKTWPKDVSGYYSLRLQLMRVLFGCDLEKRRQGIDEEARSRRGDFLDESRYDLHGGMTVELFMNCILLLDQTLTPFSYPGLMEGLPPKISRDLQDKYGEKINEGTEYLRGIYRQVARETLVYMFPDIESRLIGGETV